MLKKNDKDVMQPKKKFVMYDEGKIEQFATPEEQKKIKDFAKQMYKISKSHQKNNS